MYEFARTEVPYYRDHAELYGELPTGGGSAREILQCLPILQKQALRARNDDFFPSPLPRFTKFNTSSGTTGTPTRIAGTVWERGFVQAVIDAWFTKLTGKRWPRVLHLSGFATPSADSDDIVWEDRLNGNSCLSIYALDQDTSRQIDRIHPVVSTRSDLRLPIGDSSVRPHPRRKAVEEPGHRRDDVGAVGTPVAGTTSPAPSVARVYDFYSAAESCFAAAECEAGALHLDPLLGVVELVDDDDRPVAPGNSAASSRPDSPAGACRWCGTTSATRARSTGFTTDCPCGLSWPTIGAVEGRDEDLVLTRDGRRIGHLCQSCHPQSRRKGYSSRRNSFSSDLSGFSAIWSPAPSTPHSVRRSSGSSWRSSPSA